MTGQSTPIILHNYPESPVAEKVRVVFGIKNLAWASVKIPRLPPKPMLTCLTGGYRRTPVMQIGADIYCDSLCIISELQKRHPTPSLYPADLTGIVWCLGRWTDGDLFDLVVKMVLGAAGDNLPENFAEDRGRLYFGDNWAEGLKLANSALPHLVSQIRIPLTKLNGMLADGRKFLMGDMPSAIDAQFYYMVWFMRGRWDRGERFLAEFEELTGWEARVRELGHGDMSELPPESAIEIATAAIPAEPPAFSNVDDPQGLEIGMRVVVSPDLDSGEQPVEGSIVFADTNRVTIHWNNNIAGDLHVHFPRAGYRIEIL
ncbi:MAG: glutathione S-transferase family protein [Rhizobiaceae bacterium]